jgi:hypothetical protein
LELYQTFLTNLVTWTDHQTWSTFLRNRLRNFDLKARQYSGNSKRINLDDTPQSIRATLIDLHPGMLLTNMLVEDAIMEEESAMSDWLTRTGKTHLEARWEVGVPMLRFYLWTNEGEIELGEEDTKNYSIDQVWLALQTNNPGKLKEHRMHKLHDGDRELMWVDLRVPKATIVLNKRVILGLSDRTKPLRTAGPMFGTSWHLFAPDGDVFSERVDIWIPEEIKLAQLIVNCIYPHCHQGLDVRSTFHWKGRVAPPRQLLSGQVLEMASTMAARGPGVGMAKLQVQDSTFQITIRRDLKVEDLLRTPADLLIENGSCGNIQLDAELNEEVDFERVYQVSEALPVAVVIDPRRSE